MTHNEYMFKTCLYSMFIHVSLIPASLATPDSTLSYASAMDSNTFRKGIRDETCSVQRSAEGFDGVHAL